MRNWPAVGLIRAWLASCLLETGELAAALKAAQEAATTQRSTGAGNDLAGVLLVLSRIELASGDIGGAVNHLTESLQVFESIRNPFGIGLCLHQLAALAVAADQVVAAQSLGFTAAWFARHGKPPRIRLAEAAATKAAVESGLGKERCDAAQAEGALLSLDEAIALARELLNAVARDGGRQ